MFFLELFIWHPERIAIVAGLFLVGYLALRWSSRFRAWPLLVAAVAWGLFALAEWSAKAEGANIRVDLFFTAPLLLVVTVWALTATFWVKSRA